MRILSIKQIILKKLVVFVLYTLGNTSICLVSKAILVPILGKHIPPTECHNKPEQNVCSGYLRTPKILAGNWGRRIESDIPLTSEFTSFSSSGIAQPGLKEAQNLDLGNQHRESAHESP